MDSPDPQKLKVWTCLVVFPFEVPGYFPEVFAQRVSAKANTPEEAWDIISHEVRAWTEDPQWVAENLCDMKGLSEEQACEVFIRTFRPTFIDLYPLCELETHSTQMGWDYAEHRAVEQ